jgi:hypothetical protein
MDFVLFIGPRQLILIIITGFFCIVIPTVTALLDIVKSEFAGNNKIVWVLIVIIGNLLGVLLYFTVGTKQKIQSSNKDLLNP